MVDVTLSRADLKVTAKALIDTGSPICIFPRGIGDLLAIDFDGHGVATVFTLAGQRWRAVPETVDLCLAPFNDLGWSAKVEFVMDGDLSYAILGYEGFLDRWAVSMNGAAGYFLIEPADQLDRRTPPAVLQEFRRQWPNL
ncbi:MAG TPA: hypothetical protein VMR97_09960 [Acidimicrobiales bacterium]|nr:hypothetical protein [Acidimicrobiales bacterium]